VPNFYSDHTSLQIIPATPLHLLVAPALVNHAVPPFQQLSLQVCLPSIDNIDFQWKKTVKQSHCNPNNEIIIFTKKGSYLKYFDSFTL
jgi:hypothetical protein